mmetsp:Transcript_36447/g.96986  ORF Transcript_36447/g.96986 Transcript_36447/m.96986 type:complete len:216 (-) Transcript_36447:220-867(-)
MPHVNVQRVRTNPGGITQSSTRLLARLRHCACCPSNQTLQDSSKTASVRDCLVCVLSHANCPLDSRQQRSVTRVECNQRWHLAATVHLLVVAATLRGIETMSYVISQESLDRTMSPGSIHGQAPHTFLFDDLALCVCRVLLQLRPIAGIHSVDLIRALPAKACGKARSVVVLIKAVRGDKRLQQAEGLVCITTHTSNLCHVEAVPWWIAKGRTPS